MRIKTLVLAELPLWEGGTSKRSNPQKPGLVVILFDIFFHNSAETWSET